MIKQNVTHVKALLLDIYEREEGSTKDFSWSAGHFITYLTEGETKEVKKSRIVEAYVAKAEKILEYAHWGGVHRIRNHGKRNHKRGSDSRFLRRKK